MVILYIMGYYIWLLVLIIFSFFEKTSTVWICTMITTFLTVARQAFVQFDNFNLLKCLHETNRTLEYKVKERTRDLAELAYLDSLTHLPNRRMFEYRLNVSLANAREDGNLFAVLFLDLDRFKLINDSMGHNSGDELLRTIAGLLKNCIHETDTVARLGGDEFAVIVGNCRNHDEAAIVADRIIQEFRKPVLLLGLEVSVTCSIGIALYPQDGEDAKTLMKHADTAMYHAKEQGKNTFASYSHELHRKISQKMILERDLYKAVEQNEFIIHYQPQVNVETNQIIGVESLVR